MMPCLNPNRGRLVDLPLAGLAGLAWLAWLLAGLSRSPSPAGRSSRESRVANRKWRRLSALGPGPGVKNPPPTHPHPCDLGARRSLLSALHWVLVLAPVVHQQSAAPAPEKPQEARSHGEAAGPQPGLPSHAHPLTGRGQWELAARGGPPAQRATGSGSALFKRGDR
jgi:hypothetical protein